MDNEYSENTLEKISILKTRKEHTLQQLQTYRFVWWGWILSIIVGTIGYYVIRVGEHSEDITKSNMIIQLLFGSIIGPFIYAYILGAFRFLLSSRLRHIDMELVKSGAIELQENIDQNFFTKLVQINFKYLDQYYLQTQEQANKSFILSAFASITGLIIIIVGIVMMYFEKTTPAYITTSAGILSEFIAAIFFYLYNKTILKMSQYHQKLVLTQNISLALKITDEMEPIEKNKAYALLIDRLTTDVNKYLVENKN